MDEQMVWGEKLHFPHVFDLSLFFPSFPSLLFRFLLLISYSSYQHYLGLHFLIQHSSCKKKKLSKAFVKALLIYISIHIYVD